MVSTRNVTEALPVLPAPSVAAIVTVCEPSASEAGVNGDVHAAAVPLSTLQVVPAGFASVTVKATDGVCVLTTAFAAGLVIETAGAVASSPPRSFSARPSVACGERREPRHGGSQLSRSPTVVYATVRSRV